jgi:hypothetical protein
VWLGLSQLHTLGGVDLYVVPASEIASALPRLHTLGAVVGLGGTDAAPVVGKGFFELLLPRLRVLSLANFASVRTEEEYESSKEPPPALPMLQELSWRDGGAPVELSRRFMGARPLKLCTSYTVIADWLRLAAADKNAAGREAPCAPLSQIRDLEIHDVLTPLDVARVLRAAPQLRSLVVHSVRVGSDGDPFWFSDTSGRACAALSGVRHPWLRTIQMGCFVDSDSDESDEEDTQFLPPIDCALRLRRSHFPRLQCLIIKEKYNKEHRYDAMLQE